MSRQSFFPVGDPSPTRIPFKSVPLSSWATDKEEEGGEAGGAKHPFKGINASSRGTAKVKFIYGTVGNASPTFGGNPVFPESDEVTVSNNDKVYLDATVDAAGNITSLIASRSGSVPADSPSTGHYYRLLFIVAVSNGKVTSIAQSVSTNLQLFLCNGNAIWELA
jgi:hypothetical protein